MENIHHFSHQEEPSSPAWLHLPSSPAIPGFLQQHTALSLFPGRRPLLSTFTLFLEIHLPSLLPADSIIYPLCGQGQPNTCVASPGQGHSHCLHHHQSLSHGISSTKNLWFINTHELRSNLFYHDSGNFLLMVRMWDSQLACCQQDLFSITSVLSRYPEQGIPWNKNYSNPVRPRAGPL